MENTKELVISGLISNIAEIRHIIGEYLKDSDFSTIRDLAIDNDLDLEYWEDSSEIYKLIVEDSPDHYDETMIRDYVWGKALEGFKDNMEYLNTLSTTTETESIKQKTSQIIANMEKRGR